MHASRQTAVLRRREFLLSGALALGALPFAWQAAAATSGVKPKIGLIGSGNVGTPHQAAAFGDVLVLAVPYGAQPEPGTTLGAALKGKVVMPLAGEHTAAQIRQIAATLAP